MRHVIIVLGFLFVIGCKSSQIITTNKDSVKKEISKPLVVDFAEISQVKESLSYLASDELEGRETGSIGIEKAAIYIENSFKENSIKPYFKTYRDSFNLENYVGYNVVGYLPGSDSKLKNEFVILGAHYDHIGIAAEKVNGDSIANGANDDASGTVAILEWAKYFAKAKNNKRSILFALFSAEEKGLKGSEHLAEKLKEENLNLYTMINFEMIGVPRIESEAMAYLTGYALSNMAEKLNTYSNTNKEIIGFLPQAKEYNLFMRSDNYPFYQAFKVPAHAISTFDFTNFDYYHHVDDEADKMDFKHMTYFINQMIPALEGMINAPTKEIKITNE